MGAIVTSEFNGMRLTLAREIQNISSPKLAEKIGVTKQTVSQYENGLIRPSADKILAISQELKFPPKFFFEGSSDSFSPGVAYCRATTTTTRAVKLRQTNIDVLKSYIYDFFAEYIEYPSTEQLIDCMKSVAECSDMELIAKRIREKLDLSDRPIRNMSYLLQNLGIVVTSFSENVGHLDAISHIPVLTNNGESKRFYFTTYNTDKTTSARLNFTLAHELGHWLLGHIVSDVKSQADAEYRSNESDANQFASAFLLPKEAFLKDLQYPTVLNEYLRLKEKWHVSIAMMIRRAYMLEVLSPSQYQYLFRQLGSRGWRTFEPGDMVEVPTASLFSASVKILDDNRIIEKGNLLKYLNENCFTAQQKMFEDLMGLEQHTLDPAMSSSFSRVEFKPN